MQYRCTSGFTTGDRIIAGGSLIEDGDPILDTHAGYFAPVGIPAAPSRETASSDRPRSKVRAKKSDAPKVPAEEPAPVEAKSD